MTDGHSPACSHPMYDPEWWVMEHPGRCNRFCPHTLAAHICRSHCPLQKECLEMAARRPEMWAGIVIGGMIWNARPSKRRFEQPPARLKCEACTEPVLAPAC